MTKENEIDLITSKFFSTSKKRQKELLAMFFEANTNYDSIIDYLNYKKIHHSEKNVTEGDFIKIKVDTSMYPKINRSYYANKDLIDDQDMIKVKVERINIFNSYFTLRVVTEGLTIESLETIYYGNIPKQEDLFQL